MKRGEYSNFVIVAAVGALFGVLPFFFTPLAISFILVGLALSVLLGHRLSRHDEVNRRFLIVTLGIALIVRIVAVLIIPLLMEVHFGIEYTTPSDPRAFDEAARSIYQDPPTSWHIRRAHAYPHILAAMFRTFGHSLIPPRLVNVLCSLFLVIYTYDLAEKLFDQTVARVSALGVALFPSLILVTVRIGDDAISILLTIVGVYYLTDIRSKIQRGRSPVGPTIAFAVTAFIVRYVRNQIAWILLGVSVLWIVFLVGHRLIPEIRGRYLAGGSAIVIGLIAMLVFYEPTPVLEFRAFLDKWVLNNVAEAGQGFARQARASPPSLRAILGIAALILMPFPPWEILLSRRFAPVYFFAVSSLIFYLILPLILVGVKLAIFEAERLPERFPTLMTFGMLTAGIAVIYGGTVPRFRTLVEVFLLIFASVGISTDIDRYLFYIVYLGIALFTVLYYLVA